MANTLNDSSITFADLIKQ